MNLRRISGVLILAVLFKLSATFASTMPYHGPVVADLTEHPLAACHEHNAHASGETTPTLDALNTSTSSTSTCSPWDNCHHCCAVGLGMYVSMVAHQLPSAAPMRAWTHGTSLSPGPDLRPPIAWTFIATLLLTA